MSRGGFSLVEAIIALTISTAIVLLAGSLFVAQGNFYDSLGRRAEAQDNVRSVAERLAVELRSVMPGGITRATATRLEFNRPIAMGVVCDRRSGRTYVHLGMGDEVSDAVVGGYGWRSASGVWQYRSKGWGAMIDGTGGTAAEECFAEGADTVGLSHTYYSLRGVSGPSSGDLFMVHAEVEYQVKTSALDATTLGIFRTVSSNNDVEFASGLDAATAFQYRVGSTWSSSVTGGSLDDIEAIRITVSSRIAAETGGMAPAAVSWTVDIPLRNSP